MLFIGAEWVGFSCERFVLPHLPYYQVSRVTKDYSHIQYAHL